MPVKGPRAGGTCGGDFLPRPHRPLLLRRAATPSPSGKALSLRMWLLHSPHHCLAYASSPFARATAGGLSVDFVGHLEGPVDAGYLRTGPVRFVSDLRHRAYYQVVYGCWV